MLTTTPGPHSESDIVSYIRGTTPRGFYKGVLCGDDRPSRFPNGGFLVNIDRRAGPGTHWTALVVRAPYAYYVDSTGHPPPRAITESLRACSIVPILSDSKNQREATDALCGLRAALALRKMGEAASDDDAARIFAELAE